MMLFPYHLQRKVVPGLKLTPFEYYKNIVRRTMLSELSYDRIPNFTAADCYQILGIGRNEYIDILNSYKGKLFSPQSHLAQSPTAVLDDFLPKTPLDFKHIQPWFIVRAGSITVEDVQAQTPEVQKILDLIIDHDHPSDIGKIGPGLPLSEIPIDVFQELYRRGLVYVEVPIYETDCLSVPTLDGFIMNRVTGDSYETLLYKIFVSLDPQTCVKQLAIDLAVGVEYVVNAASLFVRLGFAQKTANTSDECSVEKNQHNVSNANDSAASPLSPEAKKVAFIFDSSIIAYLMLGNLSANLKKHSVTMFEVGKLTGDSLSAFYEEISSLSQFTEQVVGVYYEHAKCLSQTMRHISSALTSNEIDFRCFDLVRCGSLSSLEPSTRSRILSKNYNLLVCMAPLSYEDSHVLGSDWPLILGPTIPEICSPWFRLFICQAAGDGCLPSLLLCRGARVNRLPPPLARFSRFLVVSWGHDPVLMDIYTLFYSINDLTISFPVFIQAYDDRRGDSPLHQHFLPLPLSSDFLTRVGPKLPWMERLSKALNLSSLAGYLSVLLPDGKSEVDSEAQQDEADALNEMTFGGGIYQNTSQFLEQSVVDPRLLLNEDLFEGIVNANRPIQLLSVHLGIPLFNSALNDAVFEGLRRLQPESKSDLLSPEMRSHLASANETLRRSLVDFIKSAGGVYVRNAFSLTPDDTLTTCDKKTPTVEQPLPSKSMYCSCEGDLTEWD